MGEAGVLDTQAVLQLAPDPQVASAGQKLAASGVWSGLGTDGRAIWGECKGSAVYRVRVDLTDYTANCSCPSRKFPCKHGLGLMLLCARSMPSKAETPPWVMEWLEKRDKRAAKTGASEGEPSVAPRPKRRVSAKAVENRRAEMLAGIEQLEQWIDDLVDRGVANASTLEKELQERAKRLVDAKAGGLARLVADAANCYDGESEPERATFGVAQAAMVADCFRRIDQLVPEDAQSINALMGVPVSEATVLDSGERKSDDWLVLATASSWEESLEQHRYWLLGLESGRYAMMLQYSARSTGIKWPMVGGSVVRFEAAFYPGADRMRILPTGSLELAGKWLPTEAAQLGLGPLVVSGSTAAPCRSGEQLVRWNGETFDQIAARFEAAMARNPLHQTIGVVLAEGIPLISNQRRSELMLRLPDGRGIPAIADEVRDVLAISGGWPVGVSGEWNGRFFSVTGVIADGEYNELRSYRRRDFHGSIRSNTDWSRSAAFGAVVAGTAGTGANLVQAMAASDPLLRAISIHRQDLTPQRQLLLAVCTAWLSSYSLPALQQSPEATEPVPVDSRPRMPSVASELIRDAREAGFDRVEDLREANGYRMSLGDSVNVVVSHNLPNGHRVPPLAWPRQRWVVRQFVDRDLRPSILHQSSDAAFAAAESWIRPLPEELKLLFSLDQARARLLIYDRFSVLAPEGKVVALRLIGTAPVEADRELFEKALATDISRGEKWQKKGDPATESTISEPIGMLARDGLARLCDDPSRAAVESLLRESVLLVRPEKADVSSKMTRVFKAMARRITASSVDDPRVAHCAAIVKHWLGKGDLGPEVQFHLEVPRNPIDGVILGQEVAGWPSARLSGLWVIAAMGRVPPEWWQSEFKLSPAELLMACVRSKSSDLLLAGLLAGLTPESDDNWRGAVLELCPLLDKKAIGHYLLRLHDRSQTHDDVRTSQLICRVIQRSKGFPDWGTIQVLLGSILRTLSVDAAQQLTEWMLLQTTQRKGVDHWFEQRLTALAPTESLATLVSTIERVQIPGQDWRSVLSERKYRSSSFPKGWEIVARIYFVLKLRLELASLIPTSVPIEPEAGVTR